MKKISDERTKPIKYILTPDNKLQQVTDLADFTIESKEVPTSKTPWEPVCRMSKRLLSAARDGNYDLVKKVLQQENGSAFATDCLGTSPLHVAAQCNHVSICQLLLENGFSKDLTNKLDKTPLHLAACVGNHKVVEIFINVGANVNCQDMLNMTPLHWAVQYRHKTIVELLLKSGAFSEMANKFGLTPLDIAEQVKEKEIIKLFEAYRGLSAVQTLVMELDTNNQILQEEDVIVDDYNGTNQIDPVVVVEDDVVEDDVVGDSNLQANENQTENQRNINNEPMIINLCENSEEFSQDTEEYSQDTQNEDPVIINVDSEINEEMPVITEKNNKVTNLRIVNGVLQTAAEDSDNTFSAVELLQEHGITMIQNDNEENSILSAAMESGHSVVLTEVGKQILNTVKQKEGNKPHIVSVDRPKKIITVTPQQFLALKNNTHILKKIVQPHQINNIRQPGIMRKNRVTPFSNMMKNQNIQKVVKPKTEVQILTEKLNKAYQTIAEYKLKLRKKQQEVERYKSQLKLFT